MHPASAANVVGPPFSNLRSQTVPSRPIAYRARYCIPLAGEQLARGTDTLSRQPHVLENVVIVVHEGVIASVDTWQRCTLPAGTTVHDLGDVCLVPPVSNAHTHLQLSSLEGKTLWNAGFTPWLRSLIPLLAEPLNTETLARHVEHMLGAGTACVGDYTGHNIGMVNRVLHAHGLDSLYFAEWFGFDHAPWNEKIAAADPASKYCHLPPVVAALVAANHTMPPVAAFTPAGASLTQAVIVPAGHALYSTQLEFLQQSSLYCQQQGLPFSIHLAESIDEEQALCTGTGPLVELYAERVLPHGWRAPMLRPVEAAAHGGLLGAHTLAVHGVQCSAADAELLAQSHTALCLCPRSNSVLGVGSPPVPLLMAAGVPLCLGTDSLASAPSLNVWDDAHTLWTEQNIPPAALLRMLTVNGASCLQRKQWGSLEKGKKWGYCTLPEAWRADFAIV